jgi:hypothetical protein
MDEQAWKRWVNVWGECDLPGLIAIAQGHGMKCIAASRPDGHAYNHLGLWGSAEQMAATERAWAARVHEVLRDEPAGGVAFEVDIPRDEWVTPPWPDRGPLEAALRPMFDEGSRLPSRLADALTAEPRTPPGRLLLIGGAGAAGTRLVRAIASAVYGSPERVHDIDLSDYADDRGGDRLVNGDWSDYVHYHDETEAKLTLAMRRQPRAVVRFTHLERANPSVHDRVLFDLLDKAAIATRTRWSEPFRFDRTVVVLSVDDESLAACVQAGRVDMMRLGTMLKERHGTPYAPALLGRLRPIVL